MFFLIDLSANETAQSVSAEARDLVEKLLVAAPSERLTINQVLKHPWLEGAAQAQLAVIGDI
jgi:serine/threonine protein kinase